MIFRKLKMNISYKVFTFGSVTMSLGKKVPTTHSSQMPVEIFSSQSKPHQIEMGNNHSAIIDIDRKLYTFGWGKHGQLGYNEDEKQQIEPKEVTFFSRNNLRCQQVICTDKSTICLTEDGDVWSWGFGGRTGNRLTQFLFQSCGPLGLNDTLSRFTPHPIKRLRDNVPTRYITGGRQFVISFNKENQIWGWGNGEHGAFGDGNNKNYHVPTRNQVLENIHELEMLESNINVDKKFIKIKSCSSYSIGLTNDNQLYGWGSNEAGQMSTQTEMGVEMYESVIFPQKIEQKYHGYQKVIDFEVGEDTVVVVTEDEKVYWAGMKINYELKLMPLETEAKVVKVVAAHRTVFVLTGIFYQMILYVL